MTLISCSTIYHTSDLFHGQNFSFSGLHSSVQEWVLMALEVYAFRRALPSHVINVNCRHQRG